MALIAETQNFIRPVTYRTSLPFSVNGSSGSDSATQDHNNNTTESIYTGILKKDLVALTYTERIALTIVVSTLSGISLCGNIGSLRVNLRRKIRPFFRACLISLALSDLFNTIFLTVVYLSKFSSHFVQIWLLGPCMCHLVPFITTTAILVSSMTLVGITLDRYFAVMKAVISFWNPDAIFSVLSMLIIWTASIGISYPVFRVYDLYPIYILTVENVTSAAGQSPVATSIGINDNGTLAKVITDSDTTIAATATTIASFAKPATKTAWEQQAINGTLSYTLVSKNELVMMCISQKQSIATYYFIVFCIIFLPSIIAFVWINTIIAKHLWNRRHTAISVDKGQRKYFAKWAGKIGEVYRKSVNKKCAKEVERQCSFPTISGSVVTFETHVGRSSQSDPRSTSAAKHSDQTKSKSNRQIRHIRMLTIIIILISTFLLLRLPAWILIITHIHGSYKQHLKYRLYFSFGILNLANSMLNPFLYTYLAETLKIAHIIKGTASNVVFECGLRLRK
ncbi:5-hydroxytryptamine receptor 2A [Anastrepha obliqua]|uniref:5-hydroxytryptamine receptor 2A n=1 Tax=Anastrepha obliqua TaxID=95512 RepID=UPI00240A2B59|nr:5-hydroxytryptamine receptor 2A [Anastrepha obliqua]